MTMQTSNRPRRDLLRDLAPEKRERLAEVLANPNRVPQRGKGYHFATAKATGTKQGRLHYVRLD